MQSLAQQKGLNGEDCRVMVVMMRVRMRFESIQSEKDQYSRDEMGEKMHKSPEGENSDERIRKAVVSGAEMVVMREMTQRENLLYGGVRTYSSICMQYTLDVYIGQGYVMRFESLSVSIKRSERRKYSTRYFQYAKGRNPLRISSFFLK